MILFSIKGTHDLSTCPGDVDGFDPYRWQRMKEQDHENARLDFIPFCYGKRICIGRMFAQDLIKVFLLEIVRNLDWEMINGMPEIKSCPFPHPADGLPLSVKDLDWQQLNSVNL